MLRALDPMLSQPLESINAEHFQSLIDAAAPEDSQTDYKRDPPGNSDKDRKEFLADVTALANTAGGYLIIGIDERRDEDGRTTGIAGAFNPLNEAIADRETQRLENMLRDGISPRLSGVRIRRVTVDGGVVLLLRVPKAWSGLHRVTYQNSGRFWARSNSGKYEMDVHQIGDAFRSTVDVTERIRRFHQDRTARIVGGDAQVRQVHGTQGATVTIHVVPIPAFMGQVGIDIQRVAQQRERLIPLGTGDRDEGARFNIDGYLVQGPLGDGRASLGYLQVFRNGVIETVSSLLVSRGEQHIPIVIVEREIVAAMNRYLRACEVLELGFPISVLISLNGVGGQRIPPRRGEFPALNPTPIDRDLLHLPDVLIDQGGIPAGRSMKPAFDALWQAGGFEGSRHYNAAGDWAVPAR